MSHTRFASGRVSGRTSRAQAGSFLLEALIAILIVALGVLGSVGLLARSMQDVDEAKHRGEAAYLANLIVGQMWISDRKTATLTADYSSIPGTGTPFTDWKTFLEGRLPNADAYDQDIVVAAGPILATTTNSLVTITIRWCPPVDWNGTTCRGATDQPHQYTMQAMIGANL